MDICQVCYEVIIIYYCANSFSSRIGKLKNKYFLFYIKGMDTNNQLAIEQDIISYQINETNIQTYFTNAHFIKSYKYF